MNNKDISKQLVSEIINLLEDYYRSGDYLSKGVEGEGYIKLRNEINDCLQALYLQSNKDNYFWFDCSLATYKNTLLGRLQEIMENSDPDKTEEELLLEDYRTFDQLTSKQRVLQFPGGKLASADYDSILNVEVRKLLNGARDKKKGYIQAKFRKFGERISKDGDTYYREPYEVASETASNDAVKNDPGTPYKIALLKELDFFSLPAIKAMNKTKQFEVIKELIGGSTRSIKGNINVLDPYSNEDRSRYTANDHLEQAKEYLRKQSK